MTVFSILDKFSFIQHKHFKNQRITEIARGKNRGKGVLLLKRKEGKLGN